ncbi:MAG: hypothetical protein IJT68_09165 [Lentisphaeria bacterium]|nr:hypothetical protein [Lentisphaeria bacterium]
MNTTKRYKYQIGLGLCAFVIMLFCSGASPFNHFASTDGSVFIVMGRGLVQGKVLYKDLFDHKGFYLYLINGIAAMIVPGNLFGLFLMEWLFAFVTASMAFSICDCFLKDKKASFLSAVLFCAFSYHYMVFEGGNTIEEYVLPLQMAALLLFVRATSGNEPNAKPVYMFLQGILVGLVFGLKPNMMLMWGPLGLAVVFMLIKKREWKNAVLNVTAGLAGVCCGILPVVLYFAVIDGLEAWFYATWSFNLSYSESVQDSIIRKMVRVLLNPVQGLTFFALLCSMFIVLKTRLLTNVHKIVYFSVVLFSFAAVSVSGRTYGHYYQHLLPGCLPLFCLAGDFVSGLRIRALYYYACICLVLCSTSVSGMLIPESVLNRYFGKNLLQLYTLRKDYRACAAVKAEKCPDSNAVLVTGNSAAFYVWLNVVPDMKYFYVPAIPYQVDPVPIDAQENAIIEHTADMVILNFSFGDRGSRTVFAESVRNAEVLKSLEENYDLQYDNPETGIEIYTRKETRI